MRIIIDGCDFNLGHISALSRERNFGVYRLQGVDGNLGKFASDTIINKTRFDIEIFDQGRLVLVGEDCLFSDYYTLNKTLKLTITWVEHSLIG